MRGKNYLYLALGVGLITAGIGLRSLRTPSQHLVVQESPLALANAIIPELMGVVKNKQVEKIPLSQLRQQADIQKFKSYLEISYHKLPSVESLALTPPGLLHHVPPQVMATSRIFGEINDRLIANPALTEEALNFFSACVLNNQLVRSVRAVCARNLEDWARVTRADISKTRIPEEIAHIANQLPHNQF